MDQGNKNILQVLLASKNVRLRRDAYSMTPSGRVEDTTIDIESITTSKEPISINNFSENVTLYTTGISAEPQTFDESTSVPTFPTTGASLKKFTELQIMIVTLPVCIIFLSLLLIIICIIWKKKHNNKQINHKYLTTVFTASPSLYQNFPNLKDHAGNDFALRVENLGTDTEFQNPRGKKEAVEKASSVTEDGDTDEMIDIYANISSARQSKYFSIKKPKVKDLGIECLQEGKPNSQTSDTECKNCSISNLQENARDTEDICTKGAVKKGNPFRKDEEITESATDIYENVSSAKQKKRILKPKAVKDLEYLCAGKPSSQTDIECKNYPSTTSLRRANVNETPVLHCIHSLKSTKSMFERTGGLNQVTDLNRSVDKGANQAKKLNKSTSAESIGLKSNYLCGPDITIDDTYENVSRKSKLVDPVYSNISTNRRA